MKLRLVILLTLAAIPLSMMIQSEVLADEIPQTIAVIDSALTDSTELAGNVVYVDFWASWCVPCRKSFPWLETMLERYQRQGLRIVAVNLDKKREAAAKFLADLPVSFPIIYDSTGVLAKIYNLKAMPTSFIYDRSGKFHSTHLGFVPEDTLKTEEMLFELLREKGDK